MRVIQAVWRVLNFRIHPGFFVLLCFIATCVILQGQFYGEWLMRYPLLALILIFLVLVTYNRFGQDFGLSHLFWHEDAAMQFRMGLYVSLLLALQWGIAYEILRDFDGDKQFKDMARFRDQALLPLAGLRDGMYGDPLWNEVASARIEHDHEQLKRVGLKPVVHADGFFRWWTVDLNELRIAEYGGNSSVATESSGDRGDQGPTWAGSVRPKEYDTRERALLIARRYSLFYVFTYLASLALLAIAVFPPIVPRRSVGGPEKCEPEGPEVRGANRGFSFLRGMLVAAVIVFLLILPCSYGYAWVFQHVWLLEASNFFAGASVPLGENVAIPIYPGLFACTIVLLLFNHRIHSPSAPARELVILGLLAIGFLAAVLQFRVLLPDPSGAARIVGWRAVEMILNIFAVTILIGIVFFIMTFLHRTQETLPSLHRLIRVTSQGAICIMLAFVSVVYGSVVQIAWLADVERMPVLQGLLAIPLIAYYVSRNNDRLKLRFPGMADYYEQARSTPNAVRLQDYYERNISGNDCLADGCVFMHDNEEILQRWRDLVASRMEPGEPKPKLAILAVSGGSIRSGVWTAKVLTELEQQIPGFPHHLRLITGASGGMIGASLYAADLQRPEPNAIHRSRDREQLEALVQRLNFDCLQPVATQLALGDLPAACLSRPPRQDRGKALEQAWETLSGGLLGQPVHSLAAGELEGWRPSLVFAPMLAEDGRRLLISNLDLKFLTRTEGPFLLDQASRCLAQMGRPSDDLYSLSAYQFFRLFPRAKPTFKISTAIRMSASFPYISPAVNLPTIPPRRVVDAGYYDNFGVNIAMSWVARHRHWLQENTSGVVLIQVRAFDSPRDIETAERSRGSRESHSGHPFRSWRNSVHWLTTPLAAALKARSAGMSFRNDEQIALMAEWFRELGTEDGNPEFFQTVSFDCNATASLNWYITQSEFDGIVGCFAPNNGNWERLQELKQWWGVPPASEQQPSVDTGKSSESELDPDGPFGEQVPRNRTPTSSLEWFT
jgi:predicted acylesterase/phospholipase RssA